MILPLNDFAYSPVREFRQKIAKVAKGNQRILATELASWAVGTTATERSEVAKSFSQ